MINFNKYYNDVTIVIKGERIFVFNTLNDISFTYNALKDTVVDGSLEIRDDNFLITGKRHLHEDVDKNLLYYFYKVRRYQPQTYEPSPTIKTNIFGKKIDIIRNWKFNCHYPITLKRFWPHCELMLPKSYSIFIHGISDSGVSNN